MNKDTTKKGQTSICDFDEDHILIRDKNLVQIWLENTVLPKHGYFKP